MKTLWRKLSFLFQRRRRDLDLEEELAFHLFPGKNPLGHLISTGLDLDSTAPMTIVGVVGDIRQNGPGDPSMAEVYMPYQQHALTATAMRILVKTVGPPERLAPAMREMARQMAPRMPVKFTTMEARIAENVAIPRFRTLLLGVFAAIAVVLSMAGLYGIVSFLVTQRTQEIGLRMALGAATGQVTKMVLTRGLGMAGFGLGAGIVASAGLTRFLQSMLLK